MPPLLKRKEPSLWLNSSHTYLQEKQCVTSKGICYEYKKTKTTKKVGVLLYSHMLSLLKK